MAWTKPPTGFTNEARGAFSERVRATALQAYSGVVQRSPVDSGRFRGNHNISINRADFSYTDKTDKNGNASIASANSTIGSIKQDPFVSIHITNGLPYAEVIEFGRYGDGPKTEGGYSSQAPQGVYKITFNNIKEALARGF